MILQQRCYTSTIQQLSNCEKKLTIRRRTSIGSKTCTILIIVASISPLSSSPWEKTFLNSFPLLFSSYLAHLFAGYLKLNGSIVTSAFEHRRILHGNLSICFAHFLVSIHSDFIYRCLLILNSRRWRSPLFPAPTSLASIFCGQKNKGEVPRSEDVGAR